MRSMNVALACALAMLLMGCAGTKLPASVSGGIDKIFPAPPHEIRGATKVDQAWIDETIEAGATCCDWVVKPRPMALDQPAKPVAAASVKPKKKKKIRDRIRSLIPT